MKRFNFLVSFLFIFLVQLNSVNAETKSVDASLYKVTIKQVELCTGSSAGSCEGAVVVGSTTQQMDIASVNIGAIVSQYGNPASLPLGETYTHMKTTMDRTIIAQNSTAISLNSGTHTCNTVAVTDDNYGGTSGHEEARKYTHVPVVVNNGTSEPMEVRMVNTAVTMCNKSDDDCSNTTSYSSWSSYGAQDEGAKKAIHKSISGDNMLMIHALSTPYTVSLITPQITMAFSTKGVVAASNVTVGTDKYCLFDAREPEVTITFK
tara:strand:+ start:1275 stop:2063 length:789 start_codon:yes stop_codon:yes gene_type:complete